MDEFRRKEIEKMAHGFAVKAVSVFSFLFSVGLAILAGIQWQAGREAWVIGLLFFVVLRFGSNRHREEMEAQK